MNQPITPTISPAPSPTRKSEGAFLVPGNEIKAPNLVNTKVLLVATLGLALLGIVNLYSATVGGPRFFTQLRNIAGGAGLAAFFGWVIPPRLLNQYAYWIYGAMCALLVVVLVVGDVRGGSQRWIELWGFSGQPSELAKLTVALITAKYFHMSRGLQAFRLRDIWPLAAMVGLVFGLILPQPDLGTAGVCLLIAGCQLMFVRVDWRSLAAVIGVGILAAITGWTVVLREYQKLRILNLFNPELDPTGSGYHSLQSLVAVGSGNLSGKGFLQGTQTQLQFLPERHTDFIFSVFAEEHGFLGAVVVFAFFVTLVYVALVIARQAKDTFTGLLAVGIAAFIFIEFAINVSMVLGMFPVVGIPLPMFSYGGTAYLSVCMGIGVLIAIDRENFGRFRKAKSFAKKSRSLVPGLRMPGSSSQ